MPSTRCWLPLVSTRMPIVKGWSDSAEKYFRVCGLPSSRIWKSSFSNPGTNAPCLSFTLKKSCTTFTLTLMVSLESSCALPESGTDGAGVC